MRRFEIAVGLVLALTAVLFMPAAEAAMPPVKPDETLPCLGQNGHKARLWVTATNVAAQNPCRQWLVISWSNPAGGPHNTDLYLAPESKFNWNDFTAPVPRPQPGAWGTHLAYPKYVCQDPWVDGFAARVYAWNDVRGVPMCGPNNEVPRKSKAGKTTDRYDCPESDEVATFGVDPLPWTADS